MLREETLYFFKLRNRGRVVLVPVVIQAFSERCVCRTFDVGSAGALHVLHYCVGRNDEGETRYLLAIHGIAAESKQADYFALVVQHRPTGITMGGRRARL